MNIINLRKQGSITNFGVNLNEKIIMFTPKFAILLLMLLNGIKFVPSHYQWITLRMFEAFNL